MTNFDFGTSREAMLRQVDEAGFAVVDANLYLDTPVMLQPLIIIIRWHRHTGVRQMPLKHSSGR
mgnify:CR=1 FL=1